LLHYFRADRAYQTARQKLDAATRSVRIQEGKVNQLTAEHTEAHKKAVETDAKARELELEAKSREERIEMLRGRQGNATNPKEYQALIVEINTQKLDKSKIEEQTITLMEQSETQRKALAELKTRVDTEVAKLTAMRGEIDTKVKEITAEVEAAKGPRDEVGKTVPPAALAFYGRMADRFEGEAMAAIEKPDVREIDYLCTGCNTYLVANIYNRLMSSRDEIVTCPSCQRILFVPEDLTPEMALSKKMPRASKASKPKGDGTAKPRAPRKKKEKGAAGGEGVPAPGSVAEALAAGASSASGKGPKANVQMASAPLPSVADGRANVDLADESEKPTDDEPTQEEQSHQAASADKSAQTNNG
jgi:predicted  nucleic acid-binding Zn-ribbon protein